MIYVITILLMLESGYTTIGSNQKVYSSLDECLQGKQEVTARLVRTAPKDRFSAFYIKCVGLEKTDFINSTPRI